jgi:hypothetical protein
VGLSLRVDEEEGSANASEEAARARRAVLANIIAFVSRVSSSKRSMMD